MSVKPSASEWAAQANGSRLGLKSSCLPLSAADLWYLLWKEERLQKLSMLMHHSVKAELLTIRVRVRSTILWSHIALVKVQ